MVGHTFVYLKDVVTLRLDKDKCTGCGLALKCAPMQFLSVRKGKSSSKLAMHVWNAVHALGTAQVQLSPSALAWAVLRQSSTQHLGDKTHRAAA